MNTKISNNILDFGNSSAPKSGLEQLYDDDDLGLDEPDDANELMTIGKGKNPKRSLTPHEKKEKIRYMKNKYL